MFSYNHHHDAFAALVIMFPHNSYLLLPSEFLLHLFYEAIVTLSLPSFLAICLCHYFPSTIRFYTTSFISPYFVTWSEEVFFFSFSGSVDKKLCFFFFFFFFFFFVRLSPSTSSLFKRCGSLLFFKNDNYAIFFFWFCYVKFLF